MLTCHTAISCTVKPFACISCQCCLVLLGNLHVPQRSTYRACLLHDSHTILHILHSLHAQVAAASAVQPSAAAGEPGVHVLRVCLPALAQFGYHPGQRGCPAHGLQQYGVRQPTQEAHDACGRNHLPADAALQLPHGGLCYQELRVEEQTAALHALQVCSVDHCGRYVAAVRATQ
jgi:hypothetical protein